MILARVPRKPSLQQYDRLPISSYEEAVQHLVKIRCDEAFSDDAYDVAVNLIADIFWQSDKKVRRDALLSAREIGVLS